MKREEIIKLLDKEIGLAIVREDEDAEGNLYISDAQLKTAEKILEEINKRRKQSEERRQYYIKRIKEIGKEENVIFEKADNKTIKDSTLFLKNKLYLIGDNICFLNNNIDIRGNDKTKLHFEF